MQLVLCIHQKLFESENNVIRTEFQKGDFGSHMEDKLVWGEKNNRDQLENQFRQEMMSM